MPFLIGFSSLPSVSHVVFLQVAHCGNNTSGSLFHITFEGEKEVSHISWVLARWEGGARCGPESLPPRQEGTVLGREGGASARDPDPPALARSLGGLA